MQNHGQPCFPKAGCRPRKARVRAVRRIIKWGMITAAGILLFLWGKSYAYQWRGYAARGGEYLLLPLPLWWKLIADTARDYRRTLKAAHMPKEKEIYQRRKTP